MKTKISLVLIILANTSNIIHAGNGGNVAAGVIGGLAGGALLGAALSKPSTREVVYVENEAPRPSKSSRKERELRQWERELTEWEQDLNNKERELNRRECALNKRERARKTTITTTKEFAE